MVHYTYGMDLIFKVRLLSWNDAKALAAPLRQSVFVKEQAVPAELEWDEHDAVSIHAVAADQEGNILGTGRLLPTDNCRIARIGRMAVLKENRHVGIGTAILEKLLQQAQAQGTTEIVLHAQLSAEGFYRRFGFAPSGSHFIEAGIPHVEMRRALRPARR
jgi:predicted GNAT family N-acyltransferase